MTKPESSLSKLFNDTPGFLAHVRERLRVDAFVNVLTGLGGAFDKTSAARVGMPRLLSPTELDWLYHGSDLAGRIVDQPVTDAMRQGVYTGDPDLDAAAGRWEALEKFADAWIWGRLYGLGALYLGVSDKHGAQAEPLDWNRVGRGDLAFIMVLDGQELSVATRIEDRRSPQYGEPRTWRVTSSAADLHGAEIHTSRLLMFEGARTSNRLRRENNDRTFSVLQRPIETLRDVDQSWRSTMLLLQDMSQAVFKINGLMSHIANGQKQIMLDRMELVEAARSVARAVVIDAENESFEHVGAANVAAIDPLLVRAFTRLAAAAGMPVTVLMGTSPAGLNATGESDIRLWYATVKGLQGLVTPQLLSLLRMIARSEGLKVPTSLKWPSLWDMTEMERATLDKTRVDASAIRITQGMTTAREERRLWIRGADPEDVLTDEEIPDAATETVGDLEPEAGSHWIDTEDGHRLEVTGTAGGKVYFLDRDDANPDRQWKWRLAWFLERCRPVEAVETPTLPTTTDPAV